MQPGTHFQNNQLKNGAIETPADSVLPPPTSLPSVLISVGATVSLTDFILNSLQNVASSKAKR